MKKPIRILGLILTVAMLLPATACKKTSETTTTTTRETTKITQQETTTEATASETETSETTETTAEPIETEVLNLKAPVAAKGCKIELKKQEDRYHYDMDLTLDSENRTIGGHVDMTFFNDSEADWDKLCLRDYSSLFIDAKTAGYDGAVETHGATTKIENITDGRSNEKIEMTRDDDVSVVWLPLSQKLAPGEKMTLSYDFVATIPTVADRYGYQDGVFCVTNFYPILAEYTKDGWSHEKFYNCGECFFSEISDYDVKLTVSEKVLPLTTGLETGEETKDGKKTVSYHAECVRDFVFCASEKFTVLEGDYKDVHIRVAYVEETPDFDKKMADKSLEAAIDSLKIFGEAFGEYPYKDLEVILAPIDAGGMEYPNLVIITKVLPEGIGNDTEYMNDYINHVGDTIVSHEIGHQWFMGIVGSNSGMQPWLDESFASYTEYVYDVAKYPDKEIRMPVTYSIDMPDSQWKDMLKQNGVTPINRSFYEFSDDMTFVSAVYNNGKIVLMDMSKILGFDEVNGIIREYIQRNAFTNADQMDFFEVLYELAGTDNAKLNEVIETYFNESVQAKNFA